jgi:TRAP-type C4-dicarboxylate transport system permease large subunit
MTMAGVRARPVLPRHGGMRAGQRRIIFLICVASPFAWVLITEEMPQHVLAWLTSTITGEWQLLLMINVVAFSMGCFLEAVPSAHSKGRP